jgi:hypothetical protein
VRLPAKVRRRCRFRRYRRRPFAGRPSPGARPGDTGHWQLDLAIGNTRTLATLDPCCQCETVASSNVASFQSKGPFLRVSSEALEKPDQEARRKGRAVHAPCRQAAFDLVNFPGFRGSAVCSGANLAHSLADPRWQINTVFTLLDRARGSKWLVVSG